MHNYFYYTANPQEPDDSAEGVLNGLPVTDSVQDQEKDEEEEEVWEEEDKLVTALQLAAISSYRWRLRRRQQWKMSVTHLTRSMYNT